MAQTNLVGKTVLGYQVTEFLGAGAFGSVYKVEKNNAAGHQVRALKHITIPTDKQYNSVFNSMGGDVSKVDNYFSEMLKNIVSEIKILNDLSEKGVGDIVRYYENDIVTTESPKRYDIYILMEYLTPLSDYISGKDFTVGDVVNLGMNVLGGLKACHENGVIHRDIKDDNIFVSAAGTYKIGDFGVSKVLKGSEKAESVKGTPNFLAPEVYLGKESYTKSVDLYSLGIVMYRLLNYFRNPFLPMFPNAYADTDEDAAFAQRMKGETHPRPFFGGDALGAVIIKAISKPSERYATADEFENALKNAVNTMTADALNEKVNFTSSGVRQNKSDDVQPVAYAETIGETPIAPKFNTTQDEDRNRSVNKKLFESIGDVPNLPVPEVEPAVYTPVDPVVTHSPKPSTGRVIGAVPPIVEMETPVAVDKKIWGKVVYAIPVLLLLVGIIAYFIVIPNIYGRVVSFIDWLFADPQNIIDTLRDPNAVLPKIHSMIGIKVFWWIWLAGFITSLFFVGKGLHKKPEPDGVGAILTKKEPYLMLQDVSAALKIAKQNRKVKELDSLINAVKRLEEKLSVESDFGYGKGAIIACENNIANQLQFLVDSVNSVEVGDVSENTAKMNNAVTNITSLLRRRIELKKR